MTRNHGVTFSEPTGRVRTARRPPGWIAPGPQPSGPTNRPDLWPAEGEDLCYLSGDWRIFQRLDGHRWSLDDLVTGWYAASWIDRVGVVPRRMLDLGCGIGAVLMLLAWRFPTVRCVGVEAQQISVYLARRSLIWNGADDRCTVVCGDFRDPKLQSTLCTEGLFDLVTGTPPYFPRGTGKESAKIQCAPCRFEHRGGIEDYCLSAVRYLAPGASFVACASATQRTRVERAALAAGLVVERWRDVIPREGKPPLISVFVLRRAGDAETFCEEPPLVVRDSSGRWTADFAAVRRDMGMPVAVPTTNQ